MPYKPVRRCRNCNRPLPEHGNMFFHDYKCAIHFRRSSKSENLTHSEVSRLMKDIVAVKVDEKIVMDRCRRCDGDCKILVAKWEKGFAVYCSAAGLREKAHELGLALVEIEIGMGPVEAKI